MLTFPHFEPHFPREQWTLPAVLAHQVRERGDKTFLSWGHDGPSWTFAEVDADRKSTRLNSSHQR